MTQNSIHTPRTRRATRRQFGLGVAAGLAGLTAWPALAQAQRVRVGYIADFHGASMVAVANKLDLWKKHGLAADIKAFTNGPIQIQALGAGDLDFGYIGPGALWLPITGRAKLISMNVVGFSDRVIAQPGIKSIQELRGKTVAVPEGTSGDMLLRLALQANGMKVEDVKRITMDPSTIVTAFASGQVDGAGIWYPHVATLKTRKPGLVELYGNKDAMPKNSFPSSFIMRNELDAPSHQSLVDSMIRVIKEANDWRQANLPQAIDLTSALIGAPRANLETEAGYAQYFSSADLARFTEDGTIDSWLRGMNELFRTFGRVPEVVDPKRYYLGARYLAAKV